MLSYNTIRLAGSEKLKIVVYLEFLLWPLLSEMVNACQ